MNIGHSLWPQQHFGQQSADTSDLTTQKKVENYFVLFHSADANYFGLKIPNVIFADKKVKSSALPSVIKKIIHYCQVNAKTDRYRKFHDKFKE